MPARCLSKSVICFALWFWVAIGQSSPAPDGDLVTALREGGFNIYFRHVATDWSQTDHLRARDDWLDCEPSRMRQLSREGREVAIEIGEALRHLEVPVGEILASPYCRTMETARLMRLGDVVPTTEVMNLRAADYFGGRQAIVTTARRLLASQPEKAKNRIIVAHGNVAREATPAYPDEGEALIFLPDGQGGFDLVARVKPSAWKALVERYPD